MVVYGRRELARLYKLSLRLCLGFALVLIAPRSSVEVGSAFDDTCTPGIEHSYYINLLHRPDRRESIERELQRARMNFTRIEAVDGRLHSSLKQCWSGDGNFTCAGKIGVKLSHMHAIDMAIEAGYESVAIFEDDFGWLPHTDPTLVLDNVRKIQSTFKNWNVIFLSANVQQKKYTWPKLSVRLNERKYTNVHTVVEAQGAHAYVVRRNYLPKIRESFARCRVTRKREIAIDQCWKMLQRGGNWFMYEPQLGTQVPSYSDIERVNVNYGIGM